MRDLLKQDVQPTAPQGSGAGNGAGQRAAPRVGVMIRAAKLLTPQGEFLCVVRDVSETGMSARIFHELPECGELLLELQNGDQYAANMVWQKDDRAGFQFVDVADVARFVESPSRFAKRQIRLNLEIPAVLEAMGSELDITLLDISGQGAKIACETLLPISAGVKLCADGLRETRAKVRWRRNGQYGLVFEDTLQFSELAQTVQAMQGKLRKNP